MVLPILIKSSIRLVFNATTYRRPILCAETIRILVPFHRFYLPKKNISKLIAVNKWNTIIAN